MGPRVNPLETGGYARAFIDICLYRYVIPAVLQYNTTEDFYERIKS